MKRKLVYASAVAILSAFAFLGSSSSANAFGKGTLMGNESGTKFCCASGTNSCSAAGCKTQIQSHLNLMIN